MKEDCFQIVYQKATYNAPIWKLQCHFSSCTRQTLTMYFQCLIPIFFVKQLCCSKLSSTSIVRLMLSFEDKAIFTCKKRSSPRLLKCTSVLDLSSPHSEAYGETASGVQGSLECVTGTAWNMSDPLPSDLPVLASQLPTNKKLLGLIKGC